MITMAAFKDLFIVTSIFSLVFIGVGITLRSGVVASGRERGSRLIGNFSRMTVGLLSGAALMSIIQQWVGLRLAFLP